MLWLWSHVPRTKGPSEVAATACLRSRPSHPLLFKTHRRRNLDNQNKLVLDALTGIVYEDDILVSELHLYRDYDRNNPRIDISVSGGNEAVAAMTSYPTEIPRE